MGKCVKKMSNKKRIAAKGILAFILFIFSLIFAKIAYADLYLNSRDGSLYLNSSNTARLQITAGGNLVLLGLVNVTLPANLTVDSGTLFVDSVNDRVGIGTTSPGKTLEVSGSINGTQLNISGPVNLAYGTGNLGIGTASPVEFHFLDMGLKKEQGSEFYGFKFRNVYI